MEKPKKPGAGAPAASAADKAGQAELTTQAVSGGKRRYLVAPRRGHMALQAGVRPMSATDMNNALASMPGVEVVHTFSSHKHAKLMSTHPDEATDTYVIHVDGKHAQILERTAPPGLIVEEDHPLGYGKTLLHNQEASLQPQSAFAQAEPIVRKVTIRVLGGTKPLAGASVSLAADGFPSSQETNAAGEATFEILQTAPGPVQSLAVRPRSGYWNSYLVKVALSSEHVNEIVLAPLSEPNPQVPPLSPLGWGQRLMGLDQVAATATGQGIRVAIVDSGADATHPLLGHIVRGVDMTNGADPVSWKQDVIGHGSHCAGIIAAKAGGGGSAEQMLMRGFVPEAEVHVLKIFPGGQFSTLLQALDYCINHDIDVVNLSLGAPQVSEAVEQKLMEAVQHGVACIVAAGNSGGPVQYPAASPYVLAVSALGLRQEIPDTSWEYTQILRQASNSHGLFAPAFSCHGPQIAVCGPGVGIVSTVPGAAFASDSGTSMAAPHVTGLAALLLADPLLRNYLGPRGAARVDRLFKLIRSICSPVQTQDTANRFGSGMPQLQNLSKLLKQV